VDEVTVLFKGRVISKQYIPTKHKSFCIKIHKLCSMIGYTHDMRIYLGKDRQNVMQAMTATDVTVRSLTRTVEGVGNKLYMDNFFPLQTYLITNTQHISTVVGLSNKTVKECLEVAGFDNKILKLKWGDIHGRI